MRDANVHAVAIEGTFDDCQALVKAMFNHHAFRDRVRLSGVNSINWARIVAQAVYYFTAAVALGAPHRKIAFTVPTGNFGDVYAGYVASRMGLPVDRLVVATNVNDILVRTFATGTYEIRDVVATTSPSMDIQVSSNFERLLFDAYGPRCASRAGVDGFAGAVAALRAVGASALKELRALFTADRADEQESAAEFVPGCARPTIASIRIPPLPWRWPKRRRAIPSVPMVVLSTAHPAKFPDAVKAACGIAPALPDMARRSANGEERVTLSCRRTRQP